jgi:hypothetical protein
MILGKRIGGYGVEGSGLLHAQWLCGDGERKLLDDVSTRSFKQYRASVKHTVKGRVNKFFDKSLKVP